MSHSRIIQVSKKVISESEYTKVSDLDVEALQSEIQGIDYVCESDNSRREDLDWLKTQLEKIDFSLDGEKIITGTDSQFLSQWKEEAVEAAENLDLWKMNLIASGAHFNAFYILDEDYGYPVSLWRWAKDIVEENTTNQTFYVGGIIDYHF